MYPKSLLASVFVLLVFLAFIGNGQAQDGEIVDQAKRDAINEIARMHRDWNFLKRFAEGDGAIELVAAQRDAILAGYEEFLERRRVFDVEMMQRYSATGPGQIPAAEYANHLNESQQHRQNVENVLLPHQKDELRHALFQLTVRSEGGGGMMAVLLHKRFVEALKLTAEQKQDLITLKTDFEKDAQALREKYEADLKALGERYTTQARKKLDPEQLQTLEQLGGTTVG